MKDQDRNFNLE